MPYSRKKQDYINGFVKENYDMIAFARPKGDKELFKRLMKEKGIKTLTDFVNLCIDEKIKRYGMTIDEFRIIYGEQMTEKEARLILGLSSDDETTRAGVFSLLKATRRRLIGEIDPEERPLVERELHALEYLRTIVK